MIPVVVVAALGALWLWSVLNDEEGIFSPVTRRVLSRDLTRQWLLCPWCSGAWFSMVISVAVYHPWNVSLLAVALASAGLTGLLGSYIGE